jgi:MFS transporter, ACS family, tartrate transporter
MRSASATASIGTKTIRKLRIRILPAVFLLFVVALLDRNNIGFAALTMSRELAISSQQFGFLFGIFFFGYFLFEIPSNLFLHKIGARVWIARILISWGIVATLTGFVHTVDQLYSARFLLGVAEAGYFPGMALYLTYWFPKREQARALALLIAANPVATILGAPVSGLILDHAHWLGVSSWRWLLILEGTPAIVCGVLTYFLLPSRPEEAKFLTADEKEWIRAELRREELQILEQRQYSALQALASGRVWHLALAYFGMMIGN